MAEKEEEKKAEEEKEEQDIVQKKVFPVKIIVMAILALTLFGGGAFVWKSGILSKPFAKETPQSSDENNTKRDIGPIYPLENFIVNLIGGSGKSYLKARLDLELSNDKLKEEIDKRLPQFRDTILILLSSKSHGDIKSLEGKFQLRTEIISMLNQHLRTGKVVNIYFTDFIVQ